MGNAAASGPSLAYRQVAKRFGSTDAVADVDLTIHGGSFVALVGQSGSGKSTLLKMANRLVEPDAGTISIDGEDASAMPLHRLRRKIGYVFQSVGLFPHLTVADNIRIGARIDRRAPAQVPLDELMELVGLDARLARRRPAELSGGQAQRVGVARALAGRPGLLLMDEPFGALDPVTRDRLARDTRKLQQRLRCTLVMVTHDMAEALLTADRVLVMDRGRIADDLAPRDLIAGKGGAVAEALVAVPRAQAEALVAMESAANCRGTGGEGAA